MKIVTPVFLCLLLHVSEFCAFVPHAHQISRNNGFLPFSRHAVYINAATIRLMDTKVEDSPSTDLFPLLQSYLRSIRSGNETNVKPIWALKRFIDSINDKTKMKLEERHHAFEYNYTELGGVLSDTLIYSFKKCGKAGDYRMIISLMDAVIEFCHGYPLLSPRVFGEAIGALAQTDASPSKLNRMWKLACSPLDVLSSPIGAYELNIMLKSLGETHQKAKAALQLYNSSDIVGDYYTASTLLNLLALSIHEDQKVSKDWISNQSDFFSPCWQYEEGMRVLNDFVLQGKTNNFVFSSALKLNERASEVFNHPGRRHKGANAALKILGIMQTSCILPDAITCSHVLSTFDKQKEWKAAVTMLKSMEKRKSFDNKLPMWHLPEPNLYAYSAAISACARCFEFNEAMKVLQRVQRRGLEINTWVYNAALSACVSPVKKNRQKRVQTALYLLDKMKSGPEHSAPDTVSYNTVLATMEGMGEIIRDEKGCRIGEVMETHVQDGKWIPSESFVSYILKEMNSNNIPRDALTYHNAIKASRYSSEAIFQFLHEATNEVSLFRENDVAEKSFLTGRASEGLLFIFNAALSTFGSGGDIDLMVRCFQVMDETNTVPNHESILHLVNGIGKGHNSKNILTLLRSLRGDQASANIIHQQYGLTPIYLEEQKSKEWDKLYSVSISSCLRANDMESAMDILNHMKQNGVAANQNTMSEVAYSYTKLAVEAASRQSIIRRKVSKDRLSEHLTKDLRMAKRHAERADFIVQELRDPPPKLLSALSSAFAIIEDYTKARMILKGLYSKALDHQSDSILLSRNYKEILTVLPALHRSLLKICASYGNATSAFSFVKDIQTFANDISSEAKELRLADAPLIPDISKPTEENNKGKTMFTKTHTDEARKAGMKGEDWKLLLIAASKAGDWKLCINTLQFLRPSLELTHPRWERHKDSYGLSRKYRKLARSLTAVLLCLEACGQDAWAVRAIDDWIAWSGRRPPKEALLTAIRIHASEGRGEAVNSLIQQVLNVNSSEADMLEYAKHTYEEIIYIGGITHLHRNGLYEDADELYLDAISKQCLPFSTSRTWKDGQHKLDLHGMNVAIANSAVRTAFRQEVLQSEENIDLIIVTGRGINSFYQMRPVIRPEVQRMLLEEFYPPLSTTSLPGNMGALRIPSDDIQKWASHQRQQRGVKMLTVAETLKNLSSGVLRRGSRTIAKSKEIER